jgi:serine/threonine protein phosphatase PrpC
MSKSEARELHVVTAGATHVGGRDNNEDSFGIHHLGPYDVLFVADGLGGHDHGELAAQAVARHLPITFEHLRTMHLSPEKDGGSQVYFPSLPTLFRMLDQDVEESKGKTVLSVAVLDRRHGRLWFAWAGDAPMLHLQRFGGGYRCVKRADAHGFGTHVFKGLGFGSRREEIRDPWQPEIWSSVTLEAGDVVVVASDGLDTLFDDDPRLLQTKTVKELPLPITLKRLGHNRLEDLSARELEGVCKRMIAGAIAAGSTDNCTLVMAVVQR